MFKLFTIIILFFSSNAIFSQDYNYIHYTIKDGLAGNTVYGVAQDKNGYLFFATENGLSRYDGKEWKTFTVKDGLPDNEVLKVFSDSKGRVWLGLFNKSVCYYYNGKIHNSKNDSLIRKINLKSFLNRIVEDENGDVIFSTNGEVINITHLGNVKSVFKRDSNEIINNSNIDLLVTKNLSDSGIYIYYGNCVKKYKGNSLKQLSIEEANNIYSSASWKKYVTQNSSFFKSYKFNTAASSINSEDVISTKDIYINTSSGCWHFFYLEKEVIEHFLPTQKIGHTLKDIEENYWFTTLGEGVFRCPSNRINTHSIPNENRSSNKEIFAITKHNIGILANASYGKNIMIKNGNTVIINNFQNNIKYSINRNEINKGRAALLINNNTSIIGFDSYLLKLQNNQPSFNYDVMPVKSVEKIDDNNVIVATGNHCFKVRVSDLKIVDTVWNDRTTYAFYQNKQYYIGTLTGLYIVDAYKKQTYLGNLNAALTRRIVCIKAAADGTLFVATADNGVVALKNNKVVKVFNDENGLSSNSCKTLHINNNALWVGSINGITKIDLTDKNKIVHYSTSDGLPSNIINAIYFDNADSTVWVGSPDGLTSFKEKDIVSKSICNLVIQSITVSNKALATDSNNYYLKHIDNNIRFQFVGISFRSGDDITYTYMLKGLDKNWHQTKDRSLNYPTLESGDYTLLLYATNKFGIISKTFQIKFTIATPFWETIWFRGLIAFLVIAAIYFFLKRRFDKAKKVQAEKAYVKQQLAAMEQLALQAQMNPHFIFNCLNSIQQFTMHDDKEKANKYLTDFAVLVRTTLDNSGKKDITIAEEALYLGRYLELEQLRFGDSFTYDIIIDESVDKGFTKMPAMLLQPYVENSLRHGIRLKKEGKGNVKVVFYEENNYLICSVKDNGVGRAASAKIKTQQHIEYQSKGMQLTAKRIELLNTEVTHKASVTIIDLMDDNNIAIGTEVILKIPLE